MKVLAIYSSPQECGSDILDFVSLENGQVIQSVCMDDLYHFPKAVKVEKPTAEYTVQKVLMNKKFIDIRRNQVGFETIPQYVSCDKEEKQILRSISFAIDNLSPNMVNCIKVSERIEIVTEYPYIKENDQFGLYLESIGINLPYDSKERRNFDNIVKLIAEHYGFEIVNLLRY